MHSCFRPSPHSWSHATNTEINHRSKPCSDAAKPVRFLAKTKLFANLFMYTHIKTGCVICGFVTSSFHDRGILCAALYNNTRNKILCVIWAALYETGAADGDKRHLSFLFFSPQTDSLCGPQDLHQQPFGHTPASLTSSATAAAVSPRCYCAVTKASEANESEFLWNWRLAQSAGHRDTAASFLYCLLVRVSAVAWSFCLFLFV